MPGPTPNVDAMQVRFALVVLTLALAVSSRAQDREVGEDSKKSDRLDVSVDYDPAELRENILDKLRFKRIWGPMGIAGYHIYPAHESGPYRGPPQQIWTNGWATSLWRDPVTGWPLQ